MQRIGFIVQVIIIALSAIVFYQVRCLLPDLSFAQAPVVPTRVDYGSGVSRHGDTFSFAQTTATQTNILSANIPSARRSTPAILPTRRIFG